MAVTRARDDVVVALGGVGGDAHSVGLVVLRDFLVRSGFRVLYLGTQNSAEQICRAARSCAAVLISNMDGHAHFYLKDLPILKLEAPPGGSRWYLGGNPSVDGDDESLERLRGLGFDRVFGGYVEPAQVIRMLDADLGLRPGDGAGEWTPVGERRSAEVTPRPPRPLACDRDTVLAQWHTGSSARDMEANAGVLHTRVSLSAVQDRAAEENRVLIHPRTGAGHVDEQVGLFEELAAAGADVLSFQIDSLTRNNAYEEVELALKDGRRADGGPKLNGYPAVNHGVAALLALTRQFADVPMQVRHSTRDPRLLAEISFAGGVTAFEGGPITYNLPYYRDFPIVDALAAWHYVDALAGLYRRRHGVVIDREFFGVLTAAMVPPCLAVCVNVLEALLAARHGVTSVSLGYAEQGHRAQDVAAIRAMRRVARHYLQRYAPGEVSVHTVFHQYMGAFPIDEEKSRQLLCGSAVTAALSGATRVMLKTHVEAARIPTAKENAQSLVLVREALLGARPEELDEAAVAAEEELIVRESHAILDAALRAGRGDPAAAVAAAVTRGYVDIPFSPSLWNAGRAGVVRDETGAVRLADVAAIPLPGDVREHHRRLVEARRRAEGGRSVEEILERDLLRVGRGDFARWPLSESGRTR